MAATKRKYSFQPDYAVPPGETLREVIDSIEMTQAELALRTGLTTVSISRILSGYQSISYETANLLELVVGIKAQFWNNLEANYREQVSKQMAIEEQKLQIEWLKNIPTGELIKRGYVQREAEKPNLLRGVLAFYGVGSVDAYNQIWKKPGVAARRSQCFESRPGPASAWLRIGEIEAGKIHCAPYD
jgi:HTH-type transcriptional regulator/antitoxin HigA